MCHERQTYPQETPRAARSRGFTLVEVIVIVTMLGLVGAVVVNLMGSQLLRSTNPATVASNAGDAEALMEAVVSKFTSEINANATSVALDNMKTYYPNNSTITIVDTASWGGSTPVRALTVTVNVGNTSYTTLLTQARTNSADNATNF